MAYDSNKPTNDGYLADFPPEMREQLRAIINDQIVDALKLCGLSPGNATGNIPVSNGTVCANLNAEKVGGNLPAAFATAGHGHSVATTSSNGFMANTDKSKLDGIAGGAEVNQNAFANVVVGATTIQADAKSDTLTLAAGANVALTPDAVNDKVTIALDGTVPIANGGTGATTAAAVLTALGITATAAELNVLDGILATLAELNILHGLIASTTELNYCDGVTGNVQTQLNGKAASSHNHTKSQITDFPTLASVATSGSYNDLNNKPSIPAVPSIATQAQAIAGTDNATIVTPLQLRNGLNAGGSAPVYACRAWVNFNGTGTVAIRGSGNVSSITDNGAGNYTINFTTAMIDDKYSISGFTTDPDSSNGDVAFVRYPNDIKTTSAVQIRSTYYSAGYDGNDISVIIHR